MSIKKTFSAVVSRLARGARKGAGLAWRVVPTNAKRWYADWRVGATEAEKRSYNFTSSVMLTFDDYGSEAQVSQLLSILRQYDAYGMFFLIGGWANSNPELVAMIRDAGHIIGNHTYSHLDLLSLNEAQVRNEIRRGPTSEWFRPPRGRYNKRIRKIAEEFGMKVCYWSIDSDDWQGVSRQYMVEKIMSELAPGAAILMHIHGAHTLEALPEIIGGIRERGYSLWKPEGLK